MSQPDRWLLCDPYCAQFKCYHEEETEMNENEEPSVTEAELARVAELVEQRKNSPNLVVGMSVNYQLAEICPRIARELAAARAHIEAIKREADKLHDECIRDGETDAYCLTSANIDALNTHTHE